MGWAEEVAEAARAKGKNPEPLSDAAVVVGLREFIRAGATNVEIGRMARRLIDDETASSKEANALPIELESYEQLAALRHELQSATIRGNRGPVTVAQTNSGHIVVTPRTVNGEPEACTISPDGRSKWHTTRPAENP